MCVCVCLCVGWWGWDGGGGVAQLLHMLLISQAGVHVNEDVSSGHRLRFGDTLALTPWSCSQTGLAKSFIIAATCAVTMAGASLRASLSPLVKALSLRSIVKALRGQRGDQKEKKTRLGVRNVNSWQALLAKRVGWGDVGL